MNKKMIKEIERMLKKENSITIKYIPSLEECSYLSSKGINVTYTPVSFNGLYDSSFLFDFITYSII